MIDVVQYDPLWPAHFMQERARLAALGELAKRIDHCGSTAVPGLCAKPVIDIQVSVDSLQPIDAYRTPLQQLGYLHMPHEDDVRCPFFHRPAQWPHTHHVHVVKAGGKEEARTLAFRDYLRDHPEIAAEYARLKRQLAQWFSATDAEGREAYAAAKGSVIEQIIQQAMAEDYPHA
jgi:GrpB-like predicted nucleotidyltransferase (UPF0157 family)